MSQRITTNTQVAIDGDPGLPQFADQIVKQIMYVIEDARSLAGDDQVVESITIEDFEEAETFGGDVRSRIGQLTVVTRLT